MCCTYIFVCSTQVNLFSVSLYILITVITLNNEPCQQGHGMHRGVVRLYPLELIKQMLDEQQTEMP